jgi:hypothetical protein
MIVLCRVCGVCVQLPASFLQLPAGMQLTQLRAFSNSLKTLCARYTQLLATTHHTRTQLQTTIQVTSEKLRRCMLFAKVKVLQEVQHIQNLLFENQDEMCR